MTVVERTITPSEEAIVTLMASIEAGLKMLGYKHTHFTGFKNPENGALVMLTTSEDDKYHFAVECRIWKEGDLR